MNKELLYALSILFILYITAIVAYHFLEGWDWIDSAYFATSTIATVGYGDMVPTTPISKLFTIVYILVGVSTGLYAILSLGKYREHALRSRFERLFESVDSLHPPLRIRKQKPAQRVGRFVNEKPR